MHISVTQPYQKDGRNREWEWETDKEMVRKKKMMRDTQDQTNTQTKNRRHARNEQFNHTYYKSENKVQWSAYERQSHKEFFFLTAIYKRFTEFSLPDYQCTWKSINFALDSFCHFFLSVFFFWYVCVCGKYTVYEHY